MPIANVNSVNLEYYVEGTGPTLLLLSGVGAHADTWGEPFLKLLRRDFRVIRLSNRGMGKSGTDDTTLTAQVMAADAAALLATLGVDSTHVFGYSMGGYIAQELTLASPELVRGLILGCTNCGPLRSVPQTPEATARFGQIFGLPPAERGRAFCLAMVSDDFAAKEAQFMEERVVAHQATDSAAFARQFGAIGSFDSYERLSSIAAPTLIIHGDSDIVIPSANSEILRERIPNVSVQMMAGVGHMFMWELPVESAAAIKKFLAEVPVGTTLKA